MAFDVGTTRRALVDHCRKNPGQWCPGLDQVRAAIVSAQRREQDRLKLPEPEQDEEQRQANLGRLREITAVLA